MNGWVRRTGTVVAGVVVASLLVPAATARAAAPNGPWIVGAFGGILEIDRRAPEPPVTLVSSAGDPAASPDGRFIAFVSNQLPAPNSPPNVFTYDRRTGEIRPVTRNTDTRVGFAWPAYSPDGRRIAVVSQGRLYTVDGATGEMTLRLDTGREIHKPAWSPDGRSIAFTMSGDTGLAAIHLLRVGSGRLRQVLSATRPGEFLHDPIWTPDSTKLLFVTSRWAPPGGDVILTDIGEVEPDGSDLRRLTGKSRFYLSPVFSPDGAKVAVLSVPPTNPEPDGGNILVFPADFSRHWWIDGDEYDDSDRLSWAPRAAATS